MPTEIGTTICCRSISAPPAKDIDHARKPYQRTQRTCEVAHIREQGHAMIIVNGDKTVPRS